VQVGVQQLLEVIGLPAFVEGRYFDVLASNPMARALRHPEVGELTLRREKLEISGSDGQLLVIYHAEPGTESARSLGLLGSLAASERA